MWFALYSFLPFLMYAFLSSFVCHFRDLEKNFVLDEDDYVLLEDNNVLGIRRPKAVSFYCPFINKVFFVRILGS